MTIFFTRHTINLNFVDGLHRAMTVNGLFEESDELHKTQTELGLDDGSGLRVVSAKFLTEQKFNWDLFRGYDTLRVLTYSASISAIVRMLDDYSFKSFECIFGYEGALRDIKDILAFQKVAVGDTRAAIMGLKDERHIHVLEKVFAGLASFRVLRKHIAHAKLYLLSNPDGGTRVVIGSANLSERAFSGKQPETLVKFDNDQDAWQHYNRMFDEIKNSASDEIALPKDRISNAEIEISETPVLADASATLVIEPPSTEEVQVTAPAQVVRVEKVVSVIGPGVSAATPGNRNRRLQITPEIKRAISRIRLVKSAEEADNRYFSIDRQNRSALLSGQHFPLEWDHESVRVDATLLLDYFKNYEDAFEGNVARLQHDYFTLMSWLYFSPFICDMRSLALFQDNDVIRYPSFAIIFGKSNCGKTSLVDTLMTSMFGYAHTVDKRSFTTSQLRGLQQGYKRFPVAFDDIGRSAFNSHGRDMIKDELLPPVSEYPGFILSMNAEPQSFPDEVVKRSMVVYTTTALPPHNEELRQRLQGRIQEMRRKLTGHLYRRYLTEIMDRLDEDRLPEDWLALSSGVLSSIISDATGESPPHWCQAVTWFEYAEKRYDRVKARLDNLLRVSAHTKRESDVPNGWMIEGDKILVWEQRDAFGRRGFDWADVPSTLIDEEASGGSRTVLHRASLEAFLGRQLRPLRRWWKLS
ncbi:MAG: NgoFVII family restriction endonuclease [Chloroflexi bacterium]|nr:NgoFVII family restriction endonuclease [Chloroflexota bacterium]